MVPTIRVNLVQSLWLPPSQGAIVTVKLERKPDSLEHSLLVHNCKSIERDTGLTVEDSLIAAPGNSITQIVVNNCSGFYPMCL